MRPHLARILVPAGPTPAVRPIARRPAHLVGNTPVLRVAEPLAPPGRGFWAKLEGFNPGGIKDRPAPAHGRAGPRRGELRARRAGSSSPPAAPSASAWRWPGMVYGHPVTLVTDPGHGAVDDPAADRLRRPASTWSPSRTRPAAGSRPAATGSPNSWPTHPAPGARTSTTTPTTSPPTPPLAAGTGRPARPHRRPGVQRGHRRPLRRASPGCCASSTPS